MSHDSGVSQRPRPSPRTALTAHTVDPVTTGHHCGHSAVRRSPVHSSPLHCSASLVYYPRVDRHVVIIISSPRSDSESDADLIHTQDQPRLSLTHSTTPLSSNDNPLISVSSVPLSIHPFIL